VKNMLEKRTEKGGMERQSTFLGWLSSRRWVTVFILPIVMVIAGAFLMNLNTQKTGPANGRGSTKASFEEVPEGEVLLPAINWYAADYLSGIPRRVMLRTTIPNRPRVNVTTYMVQPGDNLFLIAEKFSLKPESVLWGNYEVLRDNPQLLSPGQELNILPVDGVYYRWQAGDTLEAVADFFEVGPEVILEYSGNRFDLIAVTTGNLSIDEGTWLIIPGGKRALKDWGPPAISRNNPAAAAYYGSGYCGEIYEGAIGTGAFVWPTVARTLSGNDYSGIHRGIDIAGAEGNAVYAVDSGVVVFSGWSEFGYGNLLVIDHGTGWQSAYAHLSAAAVTCGQNVAQGSYIGAVGNTGRSTGPHLHFELQSEIYGKVNPWDFLIP